MGCLAALFTYWGCESNYLPLSLLLSYTLYNDENAETIGRLTGEEEPAGQLPHAMHEGHGRIVGDASDGAFPHGARRRRCARLDRLADVNLQRLLGTARRAHTTQQLLADTLRNVDWGAVSVSASTSDFVCLKHAIYPILSDNLDIGFSHVHIS